MQICVITLFPEMFSALESGVLGRAQKNGLFELTLLNLRDFSQDKHCVVDDKPYGGGVGMVMKAAPIQAAIQSAKKYLSFVPVSYLSPSGRPFDQQAAMELSQRKQLLLLAGRYEGIDERLIQSEVQEEWSVGDFILSGGELAAMCLIDAVVRLLPGVLGNQASRMNGSFVNGLLDAPCYTRPRKVVGRVVPDVLLKGDHSAIARWRLKQALGRTWERRPDLLKKRVLSLHEQVLLAEFIREKTQTVQS